MVWPPLLPFWDTHHSILILHTMETKYIKALRAIQARLNGEFDNKDLIELGGELSTDCEVDIERITNEALKSIDVNAEKVKVLITVEGGIVQSVYANTDIEYVVIDFDDQSPDPVIVGQINTPDIVIGSNEKFHEELFKFNFLTASLIEKETKKQLKKLNF